MAKKKPGRPKKTTGKVKTRYIYLTDEQEAKIKKGFKRLTDAIVAKCV